MTALRWVVLGASLFFGICLALFIVSMFFTQAFLRPISALASLSAFAALAATSASAVVAGQIRWRRRYLGRRVHPGAYWALLLVYLAATMLYAIVAVVLLGFL